METLINYTNVVFESSFVHHIRTTRPYTPIHRRGTYGVDGIDKPIEGNLYIGARDRVGNIKTCRHGIAHLTYKNASDMVVYILIGRGAASSRALASVYL